jgi:hypothetical protein
MTPTRSNGNRNGDQRRNFAPSTPMDPRSSSRIEKSFMSPTNASASRIVALNPTHARDVHEKSARDTSPHLMPLPGGNKGQNKPMPDSVHLKGDIRTPNGVVSRKQAQKPLTRTQKLDEASFRKLQNARTVQSNAQNRNKAMVRQPKKNSKAQEQREERNGQRFHGGAQSPMEMPVRSRGQPDQIAAFRNSTYGMERQEDFYFPEDFSPDIPERTSSSPGKSVKSPWGLSSLSMFSSSLLKPDIDVEAILEHNRRLDGAVSHWRQENMKLNEDLRQLREVNDQHESDLRELQTKSFKEISKSIWSPLEDHVVRETLENIHKEIEDWAEENSIKTFDDLNESCISDGEAEALLDFLRDIASTDSDNLWGQFRIWGRQEIDPELILTAVITSCMYDQVFRNPFMVLDAFEAEVPCEGQIYAQSQILDDLSELVEDELRVEQGMS